MNTRSFDIGIFQIRLFLAVAEAKSFSRAAGAMHVEQSTLSRRISQIEQALGYPLFCRESRPIQLTAEGRILHDHWQNTIRQFEASIELANASHAHSQKKLAICSLDSCILFNEMPKISHLMRQSVPDLSIAYEYVSIGQWKQRLSDRLVDLVMTVEFTLNQDEDHFASELITATPKLAGILKSSPLARKHHLTFDDLKPLKFITVDRSEAPEHEDYIRSICREHGFEPKIGRRSTNALGLPSALQNDDEVLVCDKFLRGYDNPLFKIYELPDTYSGFHVVWLSDSDNPYIGLFIDKLREVAFDQPLCDK